MRSKVMKFHILGLYPDRLPIQPILILIYFFLIFFSYEQTDIVFCFKQLRLFYSLFVVCKVLFLSFKFNMSYIFPILNYQIIYNYPPNFYKFSLLFV